MEIATNIHTLAGAFIRWMNTADGKFKIFVLLSVTIAKAPTTYYITNTFKYTR